MENYVINGKVVDITLENGKVVKAMTSYLENMCNILDMDMDAGFSYSGDVQFCLDPPILSTKRWNYDIPGLKDQYTWQIFRLRLENFEVTKAEGPKKKA